MYIDLCIKKISFFKIYFIDTFLLQQLVSYENKTDTRNIGCYLIISQRYCEIDSYLRD